MPMWQASSDTVGHQVSGEHPYRADPPVSLMGKQVCLPAFVGGGHAEALYCALLGLCPFPLFKLYPLAGIDQFSQFPVICSI